MSDEELRRLLSGGLPLAVLVATVLAVPLSFWILRRYRRAVMAGMDASAAGEIATAAPAPPALTGPPQAGLAIEALSVGSPPGNDVTGAASFSAARTGPWRLAACYTAAGAVYALLMTFGMAVADKRTDSPLQWAVLAWTYLWPAVLVVLLIAAYDRRRRGQVLGAYLGGYAVLVLVVVLRNPALPVLALWVSLLLFNIVPTVLVLVFSMRPVRAVGLLVLTALLLLAIGAQLLIAVAASSEHTLRGIVEVGAWFGLGGRAIFAAMIGAGALVGALLAWPLLRRLGGRYRERRFSDQSFIADAHFLVFGVVQSLGPAATSPRWFLIGLVAFVGYKVAIGLALRITQPPPAENSRRTLLLLRVFRLGVRSERFFDRLRRHWLHVGPVHMIAGPDLATTTIEPHEFLDYLAGRLDRRFVGSGDDSQQRVAQMREGTDPDGRHRIEAFFCRTQAWRDAMQLLASRSDAVLMDLRSFSENNQGCLYEIGALFDRVPLDRVVFLVDKTTQRPFLDDTLRAAWQQVAADSPNRDHAAPRARLFALEEATEAALLALCQALLAEPAPALASR